MSEGGIHVTVARTRSSHGTAGGAARVTQSAVRGVLSRIPDPELPVVSIVDLGMVHDVDVTRAPNGATIRVALLPTFIGCPALDVIRTSVAEHLAVFGVLVEVETSFEVPWTTDRITPAGREALAAAGVAPATDPDAMRCPYCGSANVAIDSAFGPTQCRSLFYCRGCRQPFEAMKPV